MSRRKKKPSIYVKTRRRKTRAQRQYQKYLQSPEWKDRRKGILRRANGRCERCGDECDRLHVHHLTYARLGCERDTDLLAICNRCHCEDHGIGGRKSKLGPKRRPTLPVSEETREALRAFAERMNQGPQDRGAAPCS